MTTITIQLPEDLATELDASKIPGEDLHTFLLGALEAWLQRRRPSADESAPAGLEGAFEGSAVTFVDQLIEDNQELFEELARR